MMAILGRGERGGMTGAAGWLFLAAACALVAGCGPRQQGEIPGPGTLSQEVRRLLTAERASLEYYDARARLEEMGPEVDPVLVSIARDARARPVARANALILLADRQSPWAIGVLSEALLTSEVEMLRSAAVLGLQRLNPPPDTALTLIRSAVADPARNVRLNALLALDIREVGAIRELLETEGDREVRTVAVQLVALAESRGARLAADRRGALRTAGLETDPQIVFRPSVVDTLSDIQHGDLRVELPNAPDLPLAAQAEAVAGVVPAFFSPDRSQVVFEAEGEIRVVDLESRQVVALGPGVAPRLVPFTRQFVFLREVPALRVELASGTELRYEVFRGTFASDEVEPIGELLAVADPRIHGGYSPVRWMVVSEVPEGFALIGTGITPFILPPARTERQF